MAHTEVSGDYIVKDKDGNTTKVNFNTKVECVEGVEDIDITGNAATATKFSNISKTNSNLDDYNNLTEAGFYMITNASVLNAPPNQAYSWVWVLSPSAHVTQIAFARITNTGIAARNFNSISSTWSEWYEATMEGDLDLSAYLPLAGGTMTGLLTLSGDPTVDLHAATKKYVDDKIHTYVSMTMSASTWSSSAKTYSFESTYPFASYDIEIQPAGTCTEAQYEAWANACIVGSATSNVAKAMGDVPTINIPIILKVVKK